jgi:hypothetical protein
VRSIERILRFQGKEERKKEKRENKNEEAVKKKCRFLMAFCENVCALLDNVVIFQGCIASVRAEWCVIDRAMLRGRN